MMIGLERWRKFLRHLETESPQMTMEMVQSRIRLLFPDEDGSPKSVLQLRKDAETSGAVLSEEKAARLWESLLNYERDMRRVGGFEEGI